MISDLEFPDLEMDFLEKIDADKFKCFEFDDQPMTLIPQNMEISKIPENENKDDGNTWKFKSELTRQLFSRAKKNLKPTKIRNK